MKTKIINLIFVSLLFCTHVLWSQNPKVTIISPVNEKLYIGNETINFEATATDEIDGELPDSAFKWIVKMNHGKNDAQHWHDGIAQYYGVKSGEFKTPLADDHTLGDSIYFRFMVVVTNSRGGSDTAYADIVPKQSKLTITTDPVGIEVNVQGYGALTTPLVATPTQNMLFIITAYPNVNIDGDDYQFSAWSNGQNSPVIAFNVEDKEMILVAKYTKINAVNTKLDNSNFKIYPNPVSDDLKIFSNNNIYINSISVYNNIGQIVYSRPIGNLNNLVEISTIDLSSGLYFLKISSDKGYTMHSINKQ